MARVYVVWKSDEDAGASGPNILTLQDPGTELVAADGSSATAAVSGLVAGDLMSVITEVTDNRDPTLNYPAGTASHAAFVLESTVDSMQFALWDLLANANAEALVEALIAAGMQTVGGHAIINTLTASSGRKG